MTDSFIDQPKVIQNLFHPRPEYGQGSDQIGSYQISIEVEPGISVGGWLHATELAAAPALLFFHGNGEIAADYHQLANLYRQLGITLLVMDYRGYGISGGQPTGSNLQSDGMAIYRAISTIFEENGLTPSRLYVMGRSLGSVPAIEVASRVGDEIAGLIIESGFSDTFALMRTLGLYFLTGGDEVANGFNNAGKINRVIAPTLIIHGQSDVLIPASDGETLYQQAGTENKKLVLIPGAGHNDLMMVGLNQYFGSIREFIQQ
jgi:hypothetical protein